MARVVTDPMAMDESDRPVVMAPFDPAKMHAELQSAIKAGFDGIKIQNPEPQVVRVEVPTPGPVAPREDDALTSAIKEVVGPLLAPLHMQVAAGNDATRFYSSESFAEAQPHRAVIEDMFNKAMSAGQPRSREDLFYWYKGKNPRVFAEAAEKAKSDRMAEVGRETATAGAGSPGPSANVVLPKEIDALWGMGREALDSALSDKEF